MELLATELTIGALRRTALAKRGLRCFLLGALRMHGADAPSGDRAAWCGTVSRVLQPGGTDDPPLHLILDGYHPKHGDCTWAPPSTKPVPGACVNSLTSSEISSVACSHSGNEGRPTRSAYARGNDSTLALDARDQRQFRVGVRDVGERADSPVVFRRRVCIDRPSMCAAFLR